MMIRAGIFASILGFLAGLAGVWTGLHVFEAEDAKADGLHEIVHHELVLSTRQETAIAELETAFESERVRLEQDVFDARQALGEVLVRDKALSPEVRAEAARFHDVMGELQLASLNHILAMRATLDPEQQARFDEKLVQAFNAGH
ncbi:periplasmic heavy metal sensor [Maricaulis sp.]|uniref:Spy/CpxP family protein refolding chaperone n=1 Tax=Maricaulis sp. TaxID=1486257 RepID=UPI003299B884